MNNRKLLNLLTLGLAFITIMVTFRAVNAQSGDGGTASLFVEGGVGARALSLGSAFVALADDPTAVYWNPAGLDYMQRKSASFYYTGIQYGINYSFFGAAYPTLSFGTFGFGWSRVGTDNVEEYSGQAVLGSSGSYSENEFYFSYAKQIRESLSLGGSMKIQRQSYTFGNLGDSGIGIDFGVIYRPAFDSSLLRNVGFGLNIQNLISSRKRLVDLTEKIPLNFKAGFYKIVAFGEGNALRVLFDFNEGEKTSLTYHVGSEYSFRGVASLRVGYNAGQMAFGAGTTYKNFLIDYNFGRFFDGADFDSGHRFSITFNIGRTRSEVRRVAKEQQERTLQIRVENELWFNAETDFNQGIESGRTKFYEKDYLGAFVDFSNALESAESMQEISMRLRGQVTDDPEANMRVETANSSIQEAQSFLTLADVRSDSVQRVEQKRIILEAKQSAIEKSLQDFILEHKEKGNAFFKGGFYTRALNQWQQSIDRINSANLSKLPSWLAEVKLQLEKDIQIAEKQLQGNIRATIKKADALATRSQYLQALDVLNSVRGSGLSDSERKQVESRIRRYQSQLSYEQKYREGVRLYAEKQWRQAADAFQAAVKSRPGDKKALEYYEEAQARAVATVQQMPANLRVKYSRGVAFYRKGEYAEALKVWEQVRLEQPYNKTILDAIDRVKSRLAQ